MFPLSVRTLVRASTSEQASVYEVQLRPLPSATDGDAYRVAAVAADAGGADATAADAATDARATTAARGRRRIDERTMNLGNAAMGLLEE
jgi:hypothetical protein